VVFLLYKSYLGYWIFLIQTYELQDCKKYVSSVSLPTTTTSQYYIEEVLGYDSSPISFVADLNFTYTGNHNMGLCVAQNTGKPINASSAGYFFTVASYSTTKGCGYFNNSSYTETNRTSGQLSKDTNYELLLELRANNGFYAKITNKDTNTVVYEYTGTVPITITNYKLAVYSFTTASGTFSNVRVKPL